MFKYEFYSFINNKKKVVLLIAIVLLICLDVWMVYKDSFLYEYMKNPVYDPALVYSYTLTPSSAAFLSGSSRGHILQMIVIWLLPLYLLFIIGDSHLTELRFNNYSLLQVRKNNRDLYLDKCLFSFCIAFITFFVALMVNFIICIFVFKNGLVQNQSTQDILWFMSSECPYIAYMVYILIFSFLSGIYSTTLMALSYIVKYKIPLYVIGFGLWYIQIIQKYSLTYVFQPFIEYGLSYIIPSILIFLMISVIIFFLGYKAKG